jgi:hypothetical protein
MKEAIIDNENMRNDFTENVFYVLSVFLHCFFPDFLVDISGS